MIYYDLSWEQTYSEIIFFSSVYASAARFYILGTSVPIACGEGVGQLATG
jgi:hypothetical protein